MKDQLLLLNGAYFVYQSVMCIPWVASVWYTDKWLSKL